MGLVAPKFGRKVEKGWGAPVCVCVHVAANMGVLPSCRV